MKRFSPFLLGAILMMPVVVQSQTKRCYTTEHMNELKAKDPKLQEQLNNSEQMLQQWISENQGWQNLREEPDIIPVVVHVVWKTSSQNISDEQVQSQIDVLNEDFARLNADTINTPLGFQDEAGTVPLRFCLAKRDPEGNPTTGIERRETTVSVWTGDEIKSYASGGLNAWDPERYMNIWVGNLSSQILGYAEFPTNEVSNTFGAVITYNAFGRVGNVNPPYHLGRTTTHEFSHCFNLFHIWGDDGGACNGSDLVGDTPNQGDATFSCPNYPETDNCNSTPDGIMFMNYMDYTDDDCMNIFTMGQSDRMVAAINSFYPSLLTSDGCEEVILQQVDAGSSKVFSPAGIYCSTSISPVVRIKNWGTDVLTSVKINYQVDGGSVNTYDWTGSIISLDTQSISLPAIVTTEDVHTFTAYTSEPNGIADQNIFNDTISSQFSIITSGINPPVVQGFEINTFPPADWELINNDGGITFARSTQYKKTGVASSWVDHFNDANLNSTDDLISLHVDISAITDPSLSYYYAYTYYNGSGGASYDSLRIYISPDCGTTLNSIYYDGGNSMKTANPTSSAFHPAIAQWLPKIIDLSPYATYNNATIIFRSINGSGNNFFIDDINIKSYINTGVESNFPTSIVSVIPNPGRGFFNVQLSNHYSGKMHIVVMNALGQTVYQEFISNETVETIPIDLSMIPAGMYFLRIDGTNLSVSEKIVVER